MKKQKIKPQNYYQYEQHRIFNQYAKNSRYKFAVLSKHTITKPKNADTILSIKAMIKNYTKKPVTIQAIQYNGENIDEIIEFVGKDNIEYEKLAKVWYIKTLEGSHFITNGDFIIKGIKGEFYPCKHDIFEMTYDSEQLSDTHDQTEKARRIIITLTDSEIKCEIHNLGYLEILGLLEHQKEMYIKEKNKNLFYNH